MRLTLTCPAKINTFLAVGPREASGYHQVRTEMQAVAWCDRLTIQDDGEPGQVCNWPGLPPENTLTKALRLYGEILNIPPLRITLEKFVPPESGLGAGSSDAAMLLLGLQTFSVGRPDSGLLQDLAFAIGADTPFFLEGGLARAEGYGERLTPLPDPAPQWAVIARPEWGSATAQAYAALDALTFPFREFGEAGNDFERAAPCETLEWIEVLRGAGAPCAGLSGSGSAFFGLFPTQEEAQAGAARLSSASGLPLRALDSPITEGFAGIRIAPTLGRWDQNGPDCR